METFLTVSVISLWVFVAILIVVMFFTIKLIIEFLNRYPVNPPVAASNTPRIGEYAPKFHGVDQHGNLFALSENQNKETLLVFSMEGCEVCQSVISKLPNLSRGLDNMRVVVVEQVTTPNGGGKQIHPAIHYLQSEEVIFRYGIKRAPSFALVDAYGFLVELDFLSSFKELDLRIQKSLKKVDLQENENMVYISRES